MPQEIFRVTSAGSVDDGKSTVLARLLLDTGALYDDQISKDFDPNRLADLLDGLDSEREQGITIDVAHRFFDSSVRRYQIADSPGHEQYTRNMATACAGSDALLLVVDAVQGPKPQTLHHLEIALRLGIRQIIFGINKMDKVDYSKPRFQVIHEAINGHIEKRLPHFANLEFQVIPISGLTGLNVVERGRKLSWFNGPTLLQAMDKLKKSFAADASTLKVAFQVQMVQRVEGGGRRYLGRELSGPMRIGEPLQTRSGTVRITEVLRTSDATFLSKGPEMISVELDHEIDLERGDLVSSSAIKSHSQFEADLIWLSDQIGLKGHRYLFKAGPITSSASITRIHMIDLDENIKKGESQSVQTNQIVRASLSVAKSVPLLPFRESQELGAFILISQSTGQTVAVGTINFALRRGDNIARHEFEMTPEKLAELTGNSPRVFWLTGLSGSGKSTLANRLSRELYSHGRPHAMLDGDNLRLGINRDLGFNLEDRTENIRRTAEVAKLMADSGLIVLVSLVSPLNQDRDMAKSIIGADKFNLVFVDTPISVCEERDPKGLYAKARNGEIPNFTGVNAPFEAPTNPEWRIPCIGNESEIVFQKLLERILA